MSEDSLWRCRECSATESWCDGEHKELVIKGTERAEALREAAGMVEAAAQDLSVRLTYGGVKMQLLAIVAKLKEMAG